jgi:hypothetical protein
VVYHGGYFRRIVAEQDAALAFDACSQPLRDYLVGCAGERNHHRAPVGGGLEQAVNDPTLSIRGGCRPKTQGGTLPRDTAQRPLLDRVDAFMRRHQEFTIAPPYNTLSGLWEVLSGGGTAQWDNGFRMMADLEARYPE